MLLINYDYSLEKLSILSSVYFWKKEPVDSDEINSWWTVLLWGFRSLKWPADSAFCLSLLYPFSTRHCLIQIKKRNIITNFYLVSIFSLTRWSGSIHTKFLVFCTTQDTLTSPITPIILIIGLGLYTFARHYLYTISSRYLDVSVP